MADNYTPYSGAYNGDQIDSILAKANASESYTSAEKAKLSSLSNYDDTEVKADISSLETAVSGKVDKVSGKQLSTEDFTSAEKTKLASLENYDDSDIRSLINGKVDKIAGMGLSSNDFTDILLSNLESIIAAFPFIMRRGAATLNADSDIGFDDIHETIYYRYTASAKGNPRSSGYGIIIAFAFTSYIVQFLVSQVTSDTAILYRFSGDTGSTWRSWYQISASQQT